MLFPSFHCHLSVTQAVSLDDRTPSIVTPIPILFPAVALQTPTSVSISSSLKSGSDEDKQADFGDFKATLHQPPFGTTTPPSTSHLPHPIKAQDQLLPSVSFILLSVQSPDFKETFSYFACK